MTINSEKNISGVDLFCGVGGLTFGLEKAGVNIRIGVDLDPACAYPYSANSNADFLQQDVSDLSAQELRGVIPSDDVFLLAGCAPCQPFSTYSYAPQKKKAGEREKKKLHDDWSLVEKFAKLIEELQPDLVTMENVPPLKNTGVFQRLLSALDGYFYDYKVINCAQIGLPQSRHRLVLVGSKLGLITLPEEDQSPRTVREIIGNLPHLNAGEMNREDRLHIASNLSETNMARIKASVPGGTWRDWPEHLRAKCHTKETGKTYPSVYGRMEWDKPGPTITTQCYGYGNGRFGHPDQDRAISLREAAMLQGFPADYKFLKEGEEPSFSKIGRLVGNAVPVTLGEYLGKLLMSHVNEYHSERPQTFQ